MTPAGIEALKQDEGCVLTAYPDPLTHADPWTIGYGHTGPKVHQGLAITQEEADYQLGVDVMYAERGLREAIPWVGDLDPVRMDILTNMAFNMGVEGLVEFRHTLAAVRSGDWKAAAAGMLQSKWASQVKGRAYRLAAAMQSGAWPT